LVAAVELLVNRPLVQEAVGFAFEDFDGLSESRVNLPERPTFPNRLCSWSQPGDLFTALYTVSRVAENSKNALFSSLF
jgi:hypothetical protein